MEEEISLRELIEMLLKWKWMIIGITAAAVVVAAVVSFFVLPEVYTASATVEIKPPVTIKVPAIGADDVLKNDNIIIMDSAAYRDLTVTRAVTPEDIKLQVADPEFLELVSKKTGHDLSAEDVSVENNQIAGGTDANAAAAGTAAATKFLDIKVSADSPKAAAAGANTIAEELPKQLVKITNDEQEKENEALTAQIASIEKQLKQAQAATNTQGSSIEAKKAEAKLSSLEDIYTGLLIELEENEAIKSIETPGENPFLISPAVAPAAPVKPRKMFNVAIAAVLGVMAGIFLAFFLEYWKNSAPEDKEQILEA